MGSHRIFHHEHFPIGRPGTNLRIASVNHPIGLFEKDGNGIGGFAIDGGGILPLNPAAIPLAIFIDFLAIVVNGVTVVARAAAVNLPFRKCTVGGVAVAVDSVCCVIRVVVVVGGDGRGGGDFTFLTAFRHDDGWVSN